MPPQERHEEVGRQPPSALVDGGEPFVLEHGPGRDDVAPSAGRGGAHRRPPVGCGRGHRRRRRLRLEAGPPGDGAGGHGRQHAARRRRPHGVGDEVGQRSGGRWGRVAPVGAEQRAADERSPEVGGGGGRCAHAALTKDRSARGPTSSTRSSRWTVSGTNPSVVHSTVRSIGAPADAASATARPGGVGRDGKRAGVVAEDPPAADPGDARPNRRRHMVGPRFGDHRPTDLFAGVGDGACGWGADHVRCARAVHGADQGAQPDARIAVQVGFDRRADGQRAVERLAVGGEGEDHRPAAACRGRATTCAAPRCGPPGCRCVRPRPRCRCRGPRRARPPDGPASRTPWRRRRPGRVAARRCAGRPGRAGAASPAR